MIDTLVADMLVDQAIQDNKDKRVKESVQNIQEACKKFLSDETNITFTGIGKYCEEVFGRPKERTIHNDHKDIYKPIIAAYSKLNRNNTLAGSRSSQNDIPVSVQIQINNLEKQNETLKNVLSKQFSDNADSTVISLVDTLRGGANERDGASLVGSNKLTTLQKNVIKKLLYALVDTDEISKVERGGEAFYVYKDTGGVFLNEREARSIEELIDLKEQ